ncbi:MAG: (deoxy)nucleoside triphosphate pyrophosphohydrolase [Flavobacterium sp.]|nr:MAG: (deoxy)nucleoside triphosphate pyrophosphohydrolase [Flavobacterium sp.]
MIQVCCAIIIEPHFGKVLVTQRSGSMKLPFKFEFPGGKIEANESPEKCIIREIKEELNLDIAVIKALIPNIHFYSDLTIQLIPFVCRVLEGEIILKEHISYLWLKPEDLLDLDWAEADIPILKNYLASL